MKSYIEWIQHWKNSCWWFCHDVTYGYGFSNSCSDIVLSNGAIGSLLIKRRKKAFHFIETPPPSRDGLYSVAPLMESITIERVFFFFLFFFFFFFFFIFPLFGRQRRRNETYCKGIVLWKWRHGASFSWGPLLCSALSLSLKLKNKKTGQRNRS